MKVRIGDKLRASRIEVGIKRIADMAPLVDRSPRQVQTYESGITIPPLDVLLAWAKATGKPLEYFTESDEMPDSSRQQASDTQSHPGVEALADDRETCARWAVRTDELDHLRQSIWPQPITTADLALDLLLAWRRAQ